MSRVVVRQRFYYWKQLKPITGKTNDHHIIPAFRGKSKPYADFISARGIDVDQYTITVDAGKGVCI